MPKPLSGAGLIQNWVQFAADDSEKKAEDVHGTGQMVFQDEEQNTGNACKLKA